MYWWYENSKVCYVYLHDVPGASFPTESDNEKYHKSNGWPEWFSHGWTLQEMIAPGNVQFFNQDWQSIGDKRTLACTLEEITQVPSYGERAFQCLQLEIICMSDDQSIFAWGEGYDGNGGQTGSILADDPNFFWDCGDMESIDCDEFIEEIMKNVTPEEELY
ncbi:hypothetical protein V8B97DRAFT_1917823 [Scleroderma yunnanense]